MLCLLHGEILQFSFLPSGGSFFHVLHSHSGRVFRLFLAVCATFSTKTLLQWVFGSNLSIQMQLRSVEAIFRTLNGARINYLVVGGLAVNAHGYERFTRDIDLVVQLVPDNILAGLKALAEIGYSPVIPVSPEQFADPLLREK